MSDFLQPTNPPPREPRLSRVGPTNFEKEYVERSEISTDQSLSAGGESEKLDQTPSSAFRVPPPHSVDVGRIQLRISSTSLAGNGLRTHLVYKVSKVHQLVMQEAALSFSVC